MTHTQQLLELIGAAYAGGLGFGLIVLFVARNRER